MEAPDIRIAFYQLTKGNAFTYCGTVYERYSVDERREKILIYPKGSPVASEIDFSSAGNFFKRVNGINFQYAKNSKRKIKVMNDELNDENELQDSANDFENEAKEEIESKIATTRVTDSSLTKMDDVRVTINDLKNILMGTIKQVQGNKNYISQANAINQSVNTMINLAKLSLTVMSKK